MSNNGENTGAQRPVDEPSGCQQKQVDSVNDFLNAASESCGKIATVAYCCFAAFVLFGTLICFTLRVTGAFVERWDAIWAAEVSTETEGATSETSISTEVTDPTGETPISTEAEGSTDGTSENTELEDGGFHGEMAEDVVP